MQSKTIAHLPYSIYILYSTTFLNDDHIECTAVRTQPDETQSMGPPLIQRNERKEVNERIGESTRRGN